MEEKEFRIIVKDVSSLKTDMMWIKKRLELWETNHFPTITKRLKDIEEKYYKRPSWLMSGIFAAMSTIIVGLVVYLLTQ